MHTFAVISCLILSDPVRHGRRWWPDAPPQRGQLPVWHGQPGSAAASWSSHSRPHCCVLGGMSMASHTQIGVLKQLVNVLLDLHLLIFNATANGAECH